jgi:O-antigen/teichoic acid export membrane protein
MIRMTMVVILVLCSGQLATFFSEPELTYILWGYAVIILVEGLQNPAQHLLRRRQEYLPLIKISIVAKLFSVATAISIALIYESYWALVIGLIVSSSLQVFGSYLIYPFTPKLSRHNLKAQWAFSSWLIPQAVLGFGRTQFDTFIASTMFGKASLGSYNSMKYLAYIPSQNILTPLTQPLLAQLAPLRDNPEYFKDRFAIALLMTLLIAMPMSVFCFVNAQQVVLLLMGPQWVDFAALFGWFTLLITSMSLHGTAARLFMIHANTRPLLIFETLSCIVLAILLLSVEFSDIMVFAATKIMGEIALVTAFFAFAIWQYMGLAFLLKTAIKISGVLCLAILPMLLATYWPIVDNNILQLLVNLIFYCVLYGALVLGFILTLANSHQDCRYIKELILTVSQKYTHRVTRLIG